MSEIAQHSVAEVIVADFAIVDTAGKSNLIGAGVALLGFDAQQGLTTRFSVWISVLVPTELCPAEFPVEVALVDAAGELVQMPGPAGPQPLRIAQIVTAEKPSAQVPMIQRNHIGSRVRLVMDFGSGLPLAPGSNYEWRVRLDGDEVQEVTYPFGVWGPGASPVLG
jgi:hypothetical protein